MKYWWCLKGAAAAAPFIIVVTIPLFININVE